MKNTIMYNNGNGNRIVVTTKGYSQAEVSAMACCWLVSTVRF